MRVFFIFLLLLNLLFLAWQYTQPAKGGHEVKPLPAGLKPIVLVREIDVKPVQVAVVEQVPEEMPAEQDISPMVEAEVQPEVDSCFTLGPFKDQEKVDSVSALLKDYTRTVTIRKRQESEQHRYWVYLLDAESREEAIATSKVLAKNKLKDYYIVRGGENNNRISLGHYREKASAERRMTQLKSLGYAPVMEAIYRYFDLFWLDYVLAANHSLDDGVLQDFMADGVVKLDRDCK